jgi:hypothetical protein
MPSKRKKAAEEEEEEPHEVMARKMTANYKQTPLPFGAKPPASEEEDDDDDDDDELNMGFLNTTTETKDKSRSKFAEIHSTKPAGSGGGSSSSKAKVRLHACATHGQRAAGTPGQGGRNPRDSPRDTVPAAQGQSQRLSPGTVPETESRDSPRD